MENKSNDKYELLETSIKAMESGAFNLLIARGETGMGKTYKILSCLKSNKSEFAYFNSYVTPLKFYEMLYKNKDKKFIVFDDLGSISDKKIESLLKSSCWGVADGKREVSYHTTSSKFKKLGIPDTCKINANIILIFNEKLKGFDSVVNRGVNVNFDFTFDDKIKVLEAIKGNAKIDDEIMDYVRKSCSEATKNLSIRSLVILTSIKDNGFDWKLFANELLKVDKDKQVLIDLKNDNETKGKDKKQLNELCKEWIEITGKSRSTFMRLWANVKTKKKSIWDKW